MYNYNFVPSPDLLMGEREFAGEKYQVYCMGDYLDKSNFTFLGLVRVNKDQLETIAVMRCVLQDYTRVEDVGDIYDAAREPFNAPDVSFIGRAILFSDLNEKRTKEPLGLVVAEDSHDTYDMLIENPGLMLLFTEIILEHYKRKTNVPVYMGFCCGLLLEDLVEDPEAECDENEKLFATLAQCGYKTKKLGKRSQMEYEPHTVAYMSNEMLTKTRLNRLYKACAETPLNISEETIKGLVPVYNDPEQKKAVLAPFLEINLAETKACDKNHIIPIARQRVEVHDQLWVEVEISKVIGDQIEEAENFLKKEPNIARKVYVLSRGDNFYAKATVYECDKEQAVITVPLDYCRCLDWPYQDIFGIMDSHSADLGEIAWQMFFNGKIQRKPFPRENIIASTSLFAIESGNAEILDYHPSLLESFIEGIVSIFARWPSRGRDVLDVTFGSHADNPYFVHFGKCNNDMPENKPGITYISDDDILFAAEQSENMAAFCCVEGVCGNEENFLIVANRDHSNVSEEPLGEIPWESPLREERDWYDDDDWDDEDEEDWDDDDDWDEDDD